MTTQGLVGNVTQKKAVWRLTNIHGEKNGKEEKKEERREGEGEKEGARIGQREERELFHP